MTRPIPDNVFIPDLDDYQPLEWHSMKCRLVTPIYGGGVEAGVPDRTMPVRVSAIRGQLRFWWRLLAQQHKWKLPPEQTIRETECQLWGGIGKETTASLVFLRINQCDQPMIHTDKIKEGLTWTLQWRFDDSRITEKQKKQIITREQVITQVHETLRWWAHFGGIGARTRRGCGAFEISECELPEIKKPLTEGEIQAAGCRLALHPDISPHAQSDAAIKARQTAIGRLKKFPQSADIGRSLKPHGKERMASPLIVRPLRTAAGWQPAALLLPHSVPPLQLKNQEKKGEYEVTLQDHNTAKNTRPIQDNKGNNALDAFLNFFKKQKD